MFVNIPDPIPALFVISKSKSQIKRFFFFLLVNSCTCHIVFVFPVNSDWLRAAHPEMAFLGKQRVKMVKYWERTVGFTDTFNSTFQGHRSGMQGISIVWEFSFKSCKLYLLKVVFFKTIVYCGETICSLGSFGCKSKLIPDKCRRGHDSVTSLNISHLSQTQMARGVSSKVNADKRRALPVTCEGGLDFFKSVSLLFCFYALPLPPSLSVKPLNLHFVVTCTCLKVKTQCDPVSCT